MKITATAASEIAVNVFNEYDIEVSKRVMRYTIPFCLLKLKTILGQHPAAYRFLQLAVSRGYI